MELDGVEYEKEKYSTAIAKEGGIACCYQELSVCANLTVYENFAVTVMDHRPFGRHGWRKEMIRLAEDMLENVFPGNKINVRTKTGRLPIEQKQMVEVCCAMASEGVKVLILDEPTSSLTSDRIQQFHEAIKKMRDRDISVIYISHKLEEIINISTRIVVMRNGEQTGEITTELTTIEDLVNVMGGRVNTAVPGKKRKMNLSIFWTLNILRTKLSMTYPCISAGARSWGFQGLEAPGSVSC